eukprot:2766401-Heterocapsa_arctica.AAC.1
MTNQETAAIANWRGIAGACLGEHLVRQASSVFQETRLRQWGLVLLHAAKSTAARARPSAV